MNRQTIVNHAAKLKPCRCTKPGCSGKFRFVPIPWPVRYLVDRIQCRVDWICSKAGCGQRYFDVVEMECGPVF